MGTNEQWLQETIKAYNENPTKTLQDILVVTTFTIKIFLNEPTSKFAKGVLETCMIRNKLFLESVKNCRASSGDVGT